MEWFLAVAAGSVLAFALFEKPIFAQLSNPLFLSAILLWLFGVVLRSSLAVVRHAEDLAERLGEPYGTLLLTLTITAIEVVAISAIVRHGGPNPTLVRDTLMAVIMIIMNGMVGITLLIGGIKHREQQFNLQGANAYLSVLLPLVTFALILPDFTQTTVGPTYSTVQQVAMVVVSLGLYILFLFLQVGRYHEYFEHASAPHAHSHTGRPPAWFSVVMLVAYMAAIIYLVEQFGPPVDYLLETLKAPAPLGGIIVALLVATPESIGAVKAALANQMQRAVNIFLGSVLATIGLTIPAVLIIDHLIDRPARARRRAHRFRAPHPHARRQHDHLHERPHQRSARRRPSPGVRRLCASDLSGVRAEPRRAGPRRSGSAYLRLSPTSGWR